MKGLVILFSLWAIVNGSNFLAALRMISNEIDNINSDFKLDPLIKYAKTIELKNLLDKLVEERDNENRKRKFKEIEIQMEEKNLGKRLKVEAMVYKKFLIRLMGASSFKTDFHTMRYR
jgi:hypothetical protein